MLSAKRLFPLLLRFLSPRFLCALLKLPYVLSVALNDLGPLCDELPIVIREAIFVPMPRSTAKSRFVQMQTALEFVGTEQNIL